MGLLARVKAMQRPARWIGKPADPLTNQAANVDVLLVNWLAGEIAERVDMLVLDVLHLLVAVTARGGPDIRTRQGWAHASVILNVPGHPIMPTLH